MPMCHPNCLRYKLDEVWNKSSITDTRLSKCHELNITCSIIDLQGREYDKKQKDFQLSPWTYKTDLYPMTRNKLLNNTNKQECSRTSCLVDGASEAPWPLVRYCFLPPTPHGHWSGHGKLKGHLSSECAAEAPGQSPAAYSLPQNARGSFSFFFFNVCVCLCVGARICM